MSRKVRKMSKAVGFRAFGKKRKTGNVIIYKDNVYDTALIYNVPLTSNVSCDFCSDGIASIRAQGKFFCAACFSNVSL